MMAALLDLAGPDGVVFLEVRTDNEPAISLYRSLGFVEVGQRETTSGTLVSLQAKPLRAAGA